MSLLPSESKRVVDVNGWMEIKDNPLSKVGVFKYSGAQISKELEPDQIYNVYRPAEELMKQECIDSFKLLPWTDEHAMLGSSALGLLPAERKGIEGVIGQDVYFSDGYLKGNIKVFSEHLADLIESGKKELSIGYRCMYDITAGVFNGERYDVIQRDIRGNHVATVEEGRAGPDVAVLDNFKFTFDSAELKKMADETKKDGEQAKDERSMDERMSAMEEAIENLVGEKAGKAKDEEEKKKDSEDAETILDEEESEKEEKKKDSEDADEDYEEKKKDTKDAEKLESSMDAKLKVLRSEVQSLKQTNFKSMVKEMSKRNQLAQELAYHVGTFDHAEKTLDEVAVYGLKKLGLSAQKGHEHSVLAGYLAAKKPSVVRNTPAMDSKVKVKNDQIDALINSEDE